LRGIDTVKQRSFRFSAGFMEESIREQIGAVCSQNCSQFIFVAT